MVEALFYWICFIIVMKQCQLEQKEKVMSQLDMTMKYHGVGMVYENDFRIRPRLWCVVVGFIPVVRSFVGIGYLVAVARGAKQKDWFLTKI